MKRSNQPKKRYLKLKAAAAEEKKEEKNNKTLHTHTAFTYDDNEESSAWRSRAPRGN